MGEGGLRREHRGGRRNEVGRLSARCARCWAAVIGHLRRLEQPLQPRDLRRLLVARRGQHAHLLRHAALLGGRRLTRRLLLHAEGPHARLHLAADRLLRLPRRRLLPLKQLDHFAHRQALRVGVEPALGRRDAECHAPFSERAHVPRRVRRPREHASGLADIAGDGGLPSCARGELPVLARLRSRRRRGHRERALRQLARAAKRGALLAAQIAEQPRRVHRAQRIGGPERILERPLQRPLRLAQRVLRARLIERAEASAYVGRQADPSQQRRALAHGAQRRVDRAVRAQRRGYALTRLQKHIPPRRRHAVDLLRARRVLKLVAVLLRPREQAEDRVKVLLSARARSLERSAQIERESVLVGRWPQYLLLRRQLLERLARVDVDTVYL
mmetsp:Transcript_30084/g.70060  ORF Transcript_30084/g.70060 Transcript_30084/m.70060 type:complete len:387 (-) Transcript_30084:316-1476(-)